MTKASLAQEAGLSRGHLGDIESGLYIPKDDCRRRLVAALGLDGDWVLFGKEAPSSDSASLVLKLDDSQWTVIRTLAFLTNSSPEEVVAAEVARSLAARVSEPAVSQALDALKRYNSDDFRHDDASEPDLEE